MMKNTIWSHSGSNLHYNYISNKPFPHIILDDFLPSGIIEKTYWDISEVWPNDKWVMDDYNPMLDHDMLFWSSELGNG